MECYSLIRCWMKTVFLKFVFWGCLVDWECYRRVKHSVPVCLDLVDRQAEAAILRKSCLQGEPWADTWGCGFWDQLSSLWGPRMIHYAASVHADTVNICLPLQVWAFVEAREGLPTRSAWVNTRKLSLTSLPGGNVSRVLSQLTARGLQ